jgi:Pyridoxamine 5'-phosphate oxidase
MPSPADPAVQAVFRRSMVVELATLSPRCRPFVTPLWFVTSGGAFYLTTGPETWAGKNIERHPEVTLLFYGDPTGRDGRVLRIRGTATCHRGLPSWRVLARIAVKYYVGPRALRVELRNARRWHLRRLYYAQVKGGFGYLRVIPGAAEFLSRPLAAGHGAEG